MTRFKTKRGNEGIAERIQEQAADGDVSEGWEAVADWALNRYDTRVRARLRVMGIDVPDDGPLTVQNMLEAVRSKSGLDIVDLTPQGVTDAVDKRLAVELSRALGFEVSTVFNQDALKLEVKGRVLELLADGRGGAVVSGRSLTSLRAAATFAAQGFGPDERKKAQNRFKQKKYRKSNKLVWN